jgi:monovalent cation/hydrogen antiporter
LALFESMLTLAFVAIALLQASRPLGVPYPTVLAAAGVAVATLPWAPEVAIDPHLALALFIAPALLDAGFDLPPREIKRYWRPIVALAGAAVLLTTFAVAGVAVAVAGMPVAAAIALGAIVAPPDAAASTAVLSRFTLPRSTMTVLRGESLLNDAAALMIFTAAVGSYSSPDWVADLAPELLLAAPGGVAFGWLVGRTYLIIAQRFAGTLSAILLQFAMTFGVWVAAERLHLSAVLAVVVNAMVIARYIPERTDARDRVRSYAVWEVAVFLLNVLAFMLMGLQSRVIVGRLPAEEIAPAFGFAGLVLLTVIAVRIAWVLGYNRAGHFVLRKNPGRFAATLAQAVAVSWCGMRGLVTLAAALALPADFPARDLIALSAFVVVLGTLVLQGLTLGPLLRLLDFKVDGSFDKDLAAARLALLDAAEQEVGDRSDSAAKHLLHELEAQRDLTRGGGHRTSLTPLGELKMQSLAAKRKKLAELRRTGEIDDDVFHALEQELDYAELAASPPVNLEVAET